MANSKPVTQKSSKAYTSHALAKVAEEALAASIAKKVAKKAVATATAAKKPLYASVTLPKSGKPLRASRTRNVTKSAVTLPALLGGSDWQAKTAAHMAAGLANFQAKKAFPKVF